jgi:hypothetical protein
MALAERCLKDACRGLLEERPDEVAALHAAAERGGGGGMGGDGGAARRRLDAVASTAGAGGAAFAAFPARNLARRSAFCSGDSAAQRAFVAAERSSGVILSWGWWVVVGMKMGVGGWLGSSDCVLAPKIGLFDEFKSILDDVWRCR